MNVEYFRIWYCMSYDDFLKLLSMTDDSYTQDKWFWFQKDMARTMCGFDCTLFQKFVTYAENKMMGRG